MTGRFYLLLAESKRTRPSWLHMHMPETHPVTTFRSLTRRLVEHRLCLERDVRAGIIPAAALTVVDRAYTDMANRLEVARVEIEAAGPSVRSASVVPGFIGSCARMEQQLYAALYTGARRPALERSVARVRASGEALLERLRAHLDCAARAGRGGSAVPPPLPHASRSAASGSTRDARRAGR